MWHNISLLKRRRISLLFFDQEADQTFFSPGRIKLDWEHATITVVMFSSYFLRAYGAARSVLTEVLRFYSSNFEDRGWWVPLADLKFEELDQLAKRCPSFLAEAGHVIDKRFWFLCLLNNKWCWACLLLHPWSFWLVSWQSHLFWP